MTGETLKALPDYPEADKYVDCGEVRPLPMYHLSTLLQFGEKCARAAIESLASADEGVPVVAWPRINKRMEYAAQDEFHILPPRLKRLWARLEGLADKPSRAALSAQSTAADRWISVDERLPTSGLKVLATYINRAGKRRTICAEWVAAKTVESSDSSDIGVYDEESDMYFEPEGWYEQMDNWEEYTSLVVNEGEIDYWMPLPTAPALAAHEAKHGGKG